MKPEKTNKAVKGTQLTPEQMNLQFNIATKEIFNNFGYEEIKPSIDNLLLGWISTDSFNLESNSEKFATLSFFNNLLFYFQKIDFDYISIADCQKIQIIWIGEFLTSNFGHNYKDVKKHFKTTLNCFLENDFSDDNLIRTDVIYRVEVLREYFKKIYKIKAKAKC